MVYGYRLSEAFRSAHSGVTLNTPFSLDVSTTQEQDKHASKSLMGKLAPNKNYQPPKVNPTEMKRDPTKATSQADITQQQGKVVRAKEEIKQTKAVFKEDYKQAQKVAHQAVERAAENMDIDPKAAVASVGPQSSSTDADLLLDAGVHKVAPGAESYLNAGTIAVGVGKGAKALSPGQQKAVLEEAHKITVEHSKNQEQLTGWTKSHEGMLGEKKPLDTQGYKFENLTAKDFGCLCEQTAEQQPEMDALNMADAELDDVALNLEEVKNAQNPIAAAAAKAGNYEDAKTAAGEDRTIKMIAEQPQNTPIIVATMEHRFAEANFTISNPHEVYVMSAQSTTMTTQSIPAASAPVLKPTEEFIKQNHTQQVYGV